MKKVFKSAIWLSMGLLAPIVIACSRKTEQDEEAHFMEGSTIKTCPMVFHATLEGFDRNVSSSTKAVTYNWADGDKIYVIFYKGDEMIPGEGTYSASDGWNVSYDGSLETGTHLKCEVRYFANAPFQGSSLVSLDASTEIYETTGGTYEYDGSSLTVVANMTPKTGRIRFSGTSGDEIHLTGISVYTTYSPALNAFWDSHAMMTTTVAEDGYTPYIYGVFADEDRSLGLIGSDFAYTRTCGAEVLKVGDSGYMTIPSEASHNGWRNGLIVKVNDVEFKMIPVAGLSSGLFLMGETEVTEALYRTVTGASPSADPNKPVVNIFYSDCQSFVTKLNDATHLSFSIPTRGQWTYAAQGGNLSQGYTYAGSNRPGAVAWYRGNSDGARHDVKQLAPNELGLYDMSGNVEEWTTTYCMGGNYSSAESAITTTSYASRPSTNSYSDLGLRIILTCK